MADAATIQTAVSVGVPSLAVLVGNLVNNSRLTDLRLHFDARAAETNRRIDDTKDLLRAELLRVEQVLDARLKHLEEARR